MSVPLKRRLKSSAHLNGIGEAHHALRRYVNARAAGREHAEFQRWEPEIKAWVGCTEVEAQGVPSARIRHPSMPWCTYLGNDTRIAEDMELVTFFDVYSDCGFGWTPLRLLVQKNRQKAFLEFRSRGRQLLDRARALREQPDIKPKAILADEFAVAGRGLHSLKKAKRD